MNGNKIPEIQLLLITGYGEEMKIGKLFLISKYIAMNAALSALLFFEEIYSVPVE